MSCCSARLRRCTTAMRGTKSGRSVSGLDIRKVTFQYLTGNLTLAGVDMDAMELLPHVAGLFAGGRTHSTRMAVEHELLVADRWGRTVAPDVVRGLTRGAG